MSRRGAGTIQGRLDDLKRRLRELAEEGKEPRPEFGP
jgi:hypothetical protein